MPLWWPEKLLRYFEELILLNSIAKCIYSNLVPAYCHLVPISYRSLFKMGTKELKDGTKR